MQEFREMSVRYQLHQEHRSYIGTYYNWNTNNNDKHQDSFWFYLLRKISAQTDIPGKSCVLLTSGLRAINYLGT